MSAARARLPWAVAAVLGLAALAVIAAAVLSRHESPSTARSLSRGQLLAASASVTPQSHLFGAPIRVRVDAVVDHRRLDPGRVRLLATWSPYEPAGPSSRTRADVGPYTRIHWELQLHCVVTDCAPRPGSLIRSQFEAASIHYAATPKDSEAPSDVVIAWPAVTAVSRLDPVDLERRAVVRRTGARGQLAAGRPPWRTSSASLAAVTYRLSPGLVFWTALAGALLLVAASGLLLRPFLPTSEWLRRRLGPGPTALERALAAVEQARQGDLVEQRKALELLAVELRRTGQGELAWTATELAWSQPIPEPELTGALTVNVRQAIEERSNGHHG